MTWKSRSERLARSRGEVDKTRPRNDPWTWDRRSLEKPVVQRLYDGRTPLPFTRLITAAITGRVTVLKSVCLRSTVRSNEGRGHVRLVLHCNTRTDPHSGSNVGTKDSGIQEGRFLFLHKAKGARP